MALSILAREYGRVTVPMSSIARDRHVPLRFLEGIFLQLRNAGLLESVRGVAGGYRLARPPQEISLLDVILALGEDMELISCLDICGRASECEFGLDRSQCRIRPLFGEIQKQMHGTLLRRSLADLI
ncbi:MAG: Rrf2 family transcriptional regulator [Bacteroidales bacterium]|nr:Rrf2 family transcriptional regulator [Bacteroidales bacterium]